MTATKKQTAANNADLARIKRTFNAHVFKAASETYNASGRDAARERCLADLFPAVNS